MENSQIRQIEKLLFIKNQVIPDEVWPKLEKNAPWDKLPTEYTQKIRRILDEVNNPETSRGSSTSSGPSTIPSSSSEPGTTQKPATPRPSDLEESQPVRFQSEGLSIEEEFRFIQWAQDPYDQDPFDPEELRKLNISPP
ncbi:hypothetical protein TIFTF001_050190 [Ficus carica]|uniref:Uncharacterized protein n=1 Tax=Ficus carica TaxID=3494 RepID=A0AA87YUA0_FICCA|nr:hypothetical protein TIFTF001_050190 [Ficus carica]